ncbi:MAG: sugar ABC transporter ATP-binding protein [Thermoleophilia bacterium]|nr:sugar ABC transporter ATP-binding protein [Thermoleophilia bacterium]
MTDTAQTDQPQQSPGSAALEIVELKKSFGANRVLHGVSLSIRAGELVGLMGPNGAGKSTLVKILDGVYAADSGEIRIAGERVASLADRADVGFIHQDLGLIDTFSVAENLRLGEPKVRLAGPILAHSRERELAKEALDRVSLDLDPRTIVGELSPGEKTLVGIARALQHGAQILIIDEATSTLSPRDAGRLLDTLRTLTNEGAAVVMISHKLSEILDATNRIVVLIDGEITTDEPRAGLNLSDLAQRLLQQDEVATEKSGRESAVGAALLTLEGVRSGQCGPLDLDLHSGEVIGVTGLAGSGLHDLAYLAAGVLEPEAGRVVLADRTQRSFVPPHRETQGGFSLLSVRENMTISALSRWREKGLLRLGKEGRDALGMIDRVAVAPPDPNYLFGALSGGNKQKVIFGRVMFTDAKVFVLCEPTRGVDVKTRRELYGIIARLRDEGAGVLVVTSDVEDLSAVCDRVGVIRGGQLGSLRPLEAIQPSELEELV